MQVAVWVFVVLLLVLHQWDPFGASTTLIAGVVPLPLFYHAALCVAASVVWYLVTLYAWPFEADAEPARPADEPATTSAPSNGEADR